jgi:hypothetical protein
MRNVQNFKPFINQKCAFNHYFALQVINLIRQFTPNVMMKINTCLGIIIPQNLES